MATIIRQNIDHYDDTELAALRAGYTAMQVLTDNRGYNSIAGYHGVPRWYCYHHEDPLMFLPWHRGYLLTFEQYLRDSNPALSLPYWDWASPTSRTHGVPKAFTDAKSADGSDNPLLRSRIAVPSAHPPLNRYTQRFPGDPSGLPTPDDVSQLLALSNYATFSKQLQDIHDGIHGWTGGQKGQTSGDMAVVPLAAFDPIFFSHHCMIDRIWDRWQHINGIDTIPTSIRTRPLRGFDNLTVASVLDIAQLGYSYASDEITILENN